VLKTEISHIPSCNSWPTTIRASAVEKDLGNTLETFSKCFNLGVKILGTIVERILDMTALWIKPCNEMLGQIFTPGTVDYL
jgi:hypothetical protein